MNDDDHDGAPVALVTGAARRIGAEVAAGLHDAGYRVILHYGGSREAAERGAERLNRRRSESAACVGADLRDVDQIATLAARAAACWGRLDVLVNNASSFFPTALGATTAADWDELIAVNLRAPFFLVQALAAELRRRRGAVINITDIYAERPLEGYAPYCAAKAGLLNLTRALALELAPAVRVNAIAPGAVLWPERGDDDTARQALLARTPLERTGEPAEIARTVLFLAEGASFTTGQVINVDGGRSIVP